MSESVCEINEHGDKFWRNKDGQYHRTDGPAIEQTDGYKAWYQNGKVHRLNGPAVEYADGYKAWYQNDEAHRLDGPAIEHPSGYKEFRARGKRCFTFKEFFDAIPEENREEALLLMGEFENV